MKVTAPSLAGSSAADRPWWVVWADLFKARLTFLVLLTTLVGFYVGSRGKCEYRSMLGTLLGTALLACGAAALNQLLERDQDAKMRRTQDRPLPAGRLQPDTVLGLGIVLSVSGLVILGVLANWLASLLGSLTLGVYLLIYTPMKQVTWLNTLVGAIPGALPPLLGWVGSGQGLTLEGWSLFAILFLWQIPHFLAIAWIYREDYARAGFVMLPSVDPEGVRTGRQAVLHSIGLVLVSLCPFYFRLAGLVYLVGALVLGMVFLWAAWQFSRQLSLQRARQLFLASILYLPLLLVLMVLDKTT